MSNTYVVTHFGESATNSEDGESLPGGSMNSNFAASQGLPALSTRNDAYMRDKAYTPYSELGMSDQMGERPDISFYCGDCNRHVDLRLMAEHKQYHRALEILKYKPDTRPESLALLMRRRRGVIRSLKKECAAEQRVLDPEVLRQVNNSYEFLKADLEDTFETSRRVLEKVCVDVNSSAVSCTPSCCLAIGMSSSGNERWKSSMEDTRVFQNCFGNDPHKCFAAIYDGHQGRFASEVAASELHHALLDSMARFDPRTKCTCTFNMDTECAVSEHATHSRATSSCTERWVLHEASSHVIHQIINNCQDKMAVFEASQRDTQSAKSERTRKSRDKDPFAEKMSSAFVKAHKYTDFLLSWGRDENSKVRWSGCSTLTCVFQETPGKSLETSTGKEGRVSDLSEKPSPSNTQPGPPQLKQLGVLHLANAGNVRAVLVRGNVPYRLSRDHTPANRKERQRVLKAGGDISESAAEMRVNGVLAATRGLGNHGDPELRKCVSTEPYTTSVPIDQFAQFVILASHGVWEVFGDEQAANLCLQYFHNVWLFPQNRVPLSSNALSESVLRPRHSPEADDEPPEVGDIEEADETRQDSRNVQRKKPRVSTARSHVSFAGVEEGGDSERDGSEQKEKQRRSDQRQADEDVGMRTEVGSRAQEEEEEDYEDDYEEDEEGHLGDVDTVTDVSGGRVTSLSGEQVPTQAQLEREFARGMAERLVQSALLAGARDNITVMVVLLPGCNL